MTAVGVATTVLVALVLAHGAWWTLLSCVALPRPRRHNHPQLACRPTLTIVVPAHNEEAHIGRCVASLAESAAGYGPARVLVVADNCDDATALVAKRAGANLIERHDPGHRGKHHALDFAIEHLASGTSPEIVAFVDADSTVSRNFCEAVAAGLGVRNQAVQVHYATEAAGDTSLQRLRRVAFLLSHWSRQLGASRMGLGTGIKGNGMAVRWTVARSGLGGDGVTEDAAMTLSFAGRGIAVRFVPHATVWGHMPAHYAAARSQDIRWEGGRVSLIPRAIKTAAGQICRGRLATAAAALQVASLPLSLLVAAGGALTIAAALGWGNLLLAAAASTSLVTYVGIGLAAARAPWRDVAALASAPRFLAYKATIYARILVRGHSREWERTERGSPPEL